MLINSKFLKIYILLCFITGCRIAYKPYDFENSQVISEPDYSEEKNWAALPNKYPKFINDIQYDKIENEGHQSTTPAATIDEGIFISPWHRTLSNRFMYLYTSLIIS